MGCVTTIDALIAVATLLLGACKFATTAGPLGTWYAGVWGTTGAVNVICVGLWTVILPELCAWDWFTTTIKWLVPISDCKIKTIKITLF